MATNKILSEGMKGRMKVEEEKKSCGFGAENQTGNTQDGQTYGQPQENMDYGQSGQSYGQPQENMGYGQPSYGAVPGGQSYGPYGYGQPNYNMGAVPLDQNGQPLRNNFGMKMTFSILEILACCGCNIITMILGIIACVFTAKANNAYKAGRWDEFRSQAKTATICLWVGLGVGMLYMISFAVAWTSGGLGEEFTRGFYQEYYDTYSGDTRDNSADDYNYDYDYSSDDKYDYDAEDTGATDSAAEPLHVTAGEGFNDPSITLAGITVTLPLTYSELKELGLSVDVEDEGYVINKSEYNSPALYGPGGNEIGYVHIGNQTEDPIPLKDGVVFGFWISSSELKYGDVSISLTNGLTKDATKEDFVTAYGKPDYEYASDDNSYFSYQWYSHNDEYYDSEDNSISVDFWEGKLDDLDIKYIGWE